MRKIQVLFIGTLVMGCLEACQSEGKIPFGDDTLSPGTSGRGGRSGSPGRGGSGGSSATGGSSGSSGSGGSGGSETVGESCDYDSECEALEDGYCADAARLCTAECVSHVDCGCPTGTTNNDIATGACRAACITYDDGSGYCLRACESSDECESGSFCEGLEYYGVCAPD